MKKALTLTIIATIAALATTTASAAPVSVPDPGTTSSLLLAGLAGLTVLRRFVR